MTTSTVEQKIDGLITVVQGFSQKLDHIAACLGIDFSTLTSGAPTPSSNQVSPHQFLDQKIKVEPVDSEPEEAQTQLASNDSWKQKSRYSALSESFTPPSANNASPIVPSKENLSSPSDEIKKTVKRKSKQNGANYERENIVTPSNASSSSIYKKPKWNENKQLSHSQSATATKSLFPLTLDEVKRKILLFLRNHSEQKAHACIKDWAKKVFDIYRTNKTFIQSLVTAVCEVSITDRGNKYVLDKVTMKKHLRLVQECISYDTAAQLESLAAICLFMEKMDHPEGLAMEIFDQLLKHDVVKVPSFMRLCTGENLRFYVTAEEEEPVQRVVLDSSQFWASLRENLLKL